MTLTQLSWGACGPSCSAVPSVYPLPAAHRAVSCAPGRVLGLFCTALVPAHHFFISGFQKQKDRRKQEKLEQELRSRQAAASVSSFVPPWGGQPWAQHCAAAFWSSGGSYKPPDARGWAARSRAHPLPSSACRAPHPHPVLRVPLMGTPAVLRRRAAAWPPAPLSASRIVQRREWGIWKG